MSPFLSDSSRLALNSCAILLEKFEIHQWKQHTLSCISVPSTYSKKHSEYSSSGRSAWLAEVLLPPSVHPMIIN